MKSIEQLLELSKNPYYKFTPNEMTVLDDFLSKKQEKALKSNQKKNSKNSEKNTPVRVRNIVEKTIPDVKDAPERTRSS